MSQNSSSGRGFAPRFPGTTQNFQMPSDFQPGMGIHQYFGPRSLNSNFVFQRPGTYNVGVSFNSSAGAGAGTGGSQETRPPLTPAPKSDWAQGAAGAFNNPWQGHNMGSQTSPGLMGKADQGQSSSQGQGSQGSQS